MLGGVARAALSNVTIFGREYFSTGPEYPSGICLSVVFRDQTVGQVAGHPDLKLPIQPIQRVFSRSPFLKVCLQVW